MAVFTAVKEHRSGITLGGIGTGSVELRPDRSEEHTSELQSR